MKQSRMHLPQLVEFLLKQGLSQTAAYFAGCVNDTVTEEEWIEADFVKRHVGEGSLWLEIKVNVTTAMYL